MKIILRFDDICPTMNHSVWDELSQFLIENKLKPIIAVIPNNNDPKLTVNDVDNKFWEKIANYQSLGWSVALHGYTHELVKCPGSKNFFTKLTEFTNLDYDSQLSKIQLGLEKFSSHGISCDMFIAPAHSYNNLTILALKENKIRYISDGMYLYPFKNKVSNLVHIPQQLWSFRRPIIGTWTICSHHNQWDEVKMDEFKCFVKKNRRHICSVDDIQIKGSILAMLLNLLFNLLARIIFLVKNLRK
jgi:predicted deacetylase